MHMHVEHGLNPGDCMRGGICSITIGWEPPACIRHVWRWASNARCSSIMHGTVGVHSMGARALLILLELDMHAWHGKGVCMACRSGGDVFNFPYL